MQLMAEVDFLVDIVREAGRRIQSEFRKRRFRSLDDFKRDNITKKSARELVIDADMLSQEIILSEIKKNDKDAFICSEELNNIDQLENNKLPYKYILDPLDGTHNFCFGLPYWGISLAVLNAENSPISGIIFIPELDILLKSEQTRGPTAMFREGTWKQVFVSKKNLDESLISYDNQFYKLNKRAFTIYEALSRHCFTTRISGSAVWDIALIATGKINGRIWNSTNAYDIAAGFPIILGAGGSISDFSGREIDIFSKEVIICSGKTLCQDIVKVIKGD